MPARTLRFTQWLALWLIVVAHWAGPTQAATTDPSSRLSLQPATAVHEAWPYVTILTEKQTPLTLSDVQAAVADFERPQTSYATLGVRTLPTWLRVPFRVEAVNGLTPQQWVMNIDYPPLNRIDAYITQDGRTVQQTALGACAPSRRDRYSPARMRCH